MKDSTSFYCFTSLSVGDGVGTGRVTTGLGWKWDSFWGRDGDRSEILKAVEMVQLCIVHSRYAWSLMRYFVLVMMTHSQQCHVHITLQVTTTKRISSHDVAQECSLLTVSLT